MRNNGAIVMGVGVAAWATALSGVAVARGLQPGASGVRDAQVGSDGERETPIAKWGAAMRPEIEGIVGAKFAGEVPIRVIQLDDLAQMVAAPIQKRMRDSKIKRPDGSEMGETEIRVRSMAAAFKVAERTFGMYRYEDKTVYVVLENSARYAKRHGWSADTAERAPKLAVAHELVHALQDQRTGLGERLRKASGEEWGALTAVTEGQAVWATDELAKKLDWPAANAVLWGVVTGVQTEDEPAGSEKMPKVKVPDGTPASELYELGKRFVEVQMAYAGEGVKGNERVWAIVGRPPVTMAEVREAEKFVMKP